jgi:hypothetical protein
MTHREKTEAVLRIVVSKGIACYGRRNGKGGAWECNYCKACNPSLSSLEHVAGCHIGQAAALLAEVERGEVESDWTKCKGHYFEFSAKNDRYECSNCSITIPKINVQGPLPPPPSSNADNADNGKDGE